MVLFVSGICDASCFYCPISSEKKMMDVMYADEMPLRDMRDAITEANMIKATGSGITGGDPLKFYERTSEYIRILKAEFGQSHHTHLYTVSGTRESIDAVARAGLDEIRFHPPEQVWKHMDRSVFRDRIRWSRDNNMSVGIEVPSIPDRKDETRALVEFAIKMELDFINLNELEFSDTNYQNLHRRNFSVKNDYESGAAGSSELAIDLVNEFPEFTVHYCSAAFKDGVQLKNRLKRRASSVARRMDIITPDGTIIKGIIEHSDLQEIVSALKGAGVPDDMIALNEGKKRVEIPSWIIPKLKGLVPYDMYEVEEYPTYDALEVERVKI